VAFDADGLVLGLFEHGADALQHFLALFGDLVLAGGKQDLVHDIERQAIGKLRDLYLACSTSFCMALSISSWVARTRAISSSFSRETWQLPLRAAVR